MAAKRGESTLAAKGGKGGGKGGGKAGAAAKAKPKAKPKAAAKAAPKPPGTVCPFFQKTGSCRKGANCDMVHSLLAGQGQALPANWGPPSGASMSNPFAAFSIQIGSAGVQAGRRAFRPLTRRARCGSTPLLSRRARAALDELPGDWWSLAENEPGGYQYRTVVQVLGKRVECMLDGCAGANHVTEELLGGMLNRAAELGIGTEDPRFPVVKLEKWVHPEFVHGIASGAPVPLKGAAVLRVTLLEKGRPRKKGRPRDLRAVQDRRPLDCASRMGLGFRPGPEHHILDTLSIRIPRCEDYTRVRKDRAYAFEARLSSLGWLLRARRHRQGAPDILCAGAVRARARGWGASSGRAGGSVLRRRLLDGSRLPCGLQC